MMSDALRQLCHVPCDMQRVLGRSSRTYTFHGLLLLPSAFGCCKIRRAGRRYFELLDGRGWVFDWSRRPASSWFQLVFSSRSPGMSNARTEVDGERVELVELLGQLFNWSWMRMVRRELGRALERAAWSYPLSSIGREAQNGTTSEARACLAL